MPKGVLRPENRTITITAPKALVAQIDQLAAATNRNRSNWIVTELQALVEERTRDKITVLPAAAAAEEPGQYGGSKPAAPELNKAAGGKGRAPDSTTGKKRSSYGRR